MYPYHHYHSTAFEVLYTSTLMGDKQPPTTLLPHFCCSNPVALDPGALVVQERGRMRVRRFPDKEAIVGKIRAPKRDSARVVVEKDRRRSSRF